MLDTNFSLNHQQMINRLSFDGAAQGAAAESQALELYRKAGAAGWLHQAFARLTRRPDRLADLQEIEGQMKIRSRSYAGVQVIPIERIVGTEGRTQDFDAHFLPLKGHSRSRWLSVARAMIAGKPLPPVELIQVGEVFFVRDGHHRISVARMLGQEMIEAEVTVWKVQEPHRHEAGCPQGCLLPTTI